MSAPLDLDAIRARAEAARRTNACAWHINAVDDLGASAADIPALLAEVERLREYIDRMPYPSDMDQLRAERDALWAEAERVRTERDRAEATIARVRAFAELLTEQGDEHVRGCMGQADCAACVQHDLLAAIEGTDS